MHVALLLGSKTDTEYAQKIADLLKEFGVPSEIIVASAHKVPELVIKEVEKLNARTDATVVITVVGMSNGLGGVVAGSCVHPVINCPPYKDLQEYLTDIHSNLRMPSDVPVMTVLHPKNAALCALRILGEADPKVKDKIRARIDAVKAEYGTRS
jgi:5-(carboxyamino)imidazole ribonucleotide mutase